MTDVRELAKAVLPAPAVRYLQRKFRQHHERRFAAQALTSLRWGDVELEVPRSHPLLDILKTEPLRDQCITHSAEAVIAKYPQASFLDIGANVGDTAALLATRTRNRLILVEASDYFFPILTRNARLLPNETRLVHGLAGDGSEVEGDFLHWGGTASFHVDGVGEKRVRSKRLSELADSQTRFVKTDTDGFDFAILRGNLDWLERVRPAVLFEDQIRAAGDLAQADALFRDLSRIGYSGFVVWDDPGFHLLSTQDIGVLAHLNRYLFELWQRPVPRRICNYDVLCLHRDDADLFERMSARGRAEP